MKSPVKLKRTYGAEFELKQPKINQRQIHQVNVHSKIVEEYYRISHEFLSYVIAELEEWFCDMSLESTVILKLSANNLQQIRCIKDWVHQSCLEQTI